MFDWFLLHQISHFKIPHYVMFVDSFPLTVSGKVRVFFLMNFQSTTAHIDKTKGDISLFLKVKKYVLKDIMEEALGL